jgi:DNA invertase Pin-like site-specific DNA recombinase
MSNHRRTISYSRRTSLDASASDDRCDALNLVQAGGHTDGEMIEHLEEEPGTSAARPQYDYMRSEIAAGRVEVVVASHASRITRDAREFMGFLALCAAHDVKLVLHATLVTAEQALHDFEKRVMAILAEYDKTPRRGENEEEQ